MTDRQRRLDERNKKIVALYRSGKTLAEAGAVFGLKRALASSIIIKHGVVGRRFWTKPKLGDEEKKRIKAAKFWSKAAVTADPNRCWEWRGAVDARGYGRAGWEGKSYYVRHLAWKLGTGGNPLRFVLDVCGNPGCVNPAHLRESAGKKRAKLKAD
jgi:hypothetical protein